MKKKIAVFISGRGSNMQALYRACNDENYPAEIDLVLSDKQNTEGLNFAKQHNIPTVFLSPKNYISKQDYEVEIDAIMQDYKIDYICLSGFMRLLTPYLCEKWHLKMLNIHPSLLPAFKGLDTHKRAIESGACYAGCTVHFVSSEMDSGAIINQAVVPIMQNDTEETLAHRILEQEHILYAKCLKNIITKHWIIRNNRVFYTE